MQTQNAKEDFAISNNFHLFRTSYKKTLNEIEKNCPALNLDIYFKDWNDYKDFIFQVLYKVNRQQSLNITFAIAYYCNFDKEKLKKIVFENEGIDIYKIMESFFPQFLDKFKASYQKNLNFLKANKPEIPIENQINEREDFGDLIYYIIEDISMNYVPSKITGMILQKYINNLSRLKKIVFENDGLELFQIINECQFLIVKAVKNIIENNIPIDI